MKIILIGEDSETMVDLALVVKSITKLKEGFKIDPKIYLVSDNEDRASWSLKLGSDIRGTLTKRVAMSELFW